MPPTPETPLFVEESYRQLLRAAVEAVGGQRKAASVVGVNQGTISRALKPGHNVSYTTLRKFADKLPGIPDPVVSIRDAMHERWCRIGSELAKIRPEEFRFLLISAERALSDNGPPTGHPERPSDAQFDKLKAVMTDLRPRRVVRRNTHK